MTAWETIKAGKRKGQSSQLHDRAPHSAELILIRHAPLAEAGRLFGRTDAAARLEPEAIAALRARLPRPALLISSPARRCRQTAEALWPDLQVQQDARLWEQDFGAHDGLRFDQMPDLGPLDGPDLARWTPPEGESFADLCARTAPALMQHGQTAAELGAPVVLMVHAGVIRAALSQVCGAVHAGLAFEVAPLSVTRLRCGVEGPLSVIGTNCA
ncbi:histidine phosphatase family protein [Salipiger sp. CCB-MM3]|uniref:histidine phosphatase family protein n=1 Tax=Salipiger sp. CCB-MM3 TaxID=1792508 RepID=UPI0009F6C866|nr:histidine phosphatase family protein [Salipiger sp. CCB-MM3]